MSDILAEIQDAVIEGLNKRTVQLVGQALAENVTAGQILNDALIPGIDEVGRDFEAHQCYIPEMMLSARAMREAMECLKPHLQEGDVKIVGKALIGTVSGDLHDIGKNLVIIMTEGAGFEVKDLGVDVPAERFIEAIREEQPDVLMLSALITSTLNSMRDTVSAIHEAGLKERVKILVGGAPVTEPFARQIGADGYAPDAAGAARVALQVIGK